jgi:HK97 family phage major capsid protein
METKELIEKGLADIKSMVEEKTKGIEGIEAKTAQLIADAEKKMKDANEAEIKALTDEINGRLDKLVSEMKAKSANKKVEFKSFEQSLFEQLEEKKDELEALKSKSGSVSLEIKSPVDVGLVNTLFSEGSASQVQVTDNTGIISAIRDRVQVYLQNVSVGSTNGSKVMWTEELDENGAVISVAELATKPNISVSYEERDITVKKYAAFTKVSTEMIDDAPQLVAALRTNVLKRLNLKVEKDLFVGAGTTTLLKGIGAYATNFTGGTLAGQVADANDYDVIRAVALQVQEAHGTAGAIFITPGKLAAMDVQKDDEGRYLLPPFRADNGNLVAGVRLIPTTALIGEAFDFVGGDLSVVNVRFRQGVRVEMDRSGDDFVKNLMTILVEVRLAQFVSANDVGLLVKGTFAGAKAILDPTISV